MRNQGGRPKYTDEQYQEWLDLMEPYLKCDKTLYYAIEKTHLIKYKDSIYRKYKLKDWFCEKITVFQEELAEMLNDIFYDLITRIHEKVRSNETLTNQDINILIFCCEKHRTAQKYWINRYEPVRGRPIEEVLNQFDDEREPTSNVVYLDHN